MGGRKLQVGGKMVIDEEGSDKEEEEDAARSRPVATIQY